MRRDIRLVIVELHGRLGNQLFQYACGLGIADRLSARLLFSEQSVDAKDLILPRLIPERYEVASRRELLEVGRFCYPVPGSRLLTSGTWRSVEITRRLRHKTAANQAFWSDAGQFRPELFDLDLPVYIRGNLQSELYFSHIAQDVASSLVRPADVRPIPLVPGPTVGVSFRRGDYNSLGWALPLAYYDAAIDFVLRRVSDPTFVLFGDDADFVSLMGARMSEHSRVVNAVAIDKSALAQLFGLAACDHCVIPNSSFGWWGAWLGDHLTKNDDRIVVAPSEYGERSDRLPRRWVVIPSGIGPRF